MRRISLLVITLLTCAVASAQSHDALNQRSQLERYLRKLTVERLAKIADIQAWSRYFADDYLTTTENGDVLNKKDMIPMHASNAPQLAHFSPLLEDVRFQLVGDTAILNYRVLRTTKYGNQEVRVQTRKNDVYARRHGRWELIYSQQVYIPNLLRVGKLVPPEILDRYAGQFESYPPPLQFTVARQGDKLMIRQSDEKVWTELVAAADDTFVIAGVSEQFVFVNDSSGHIPGIVVRTLGGEDYFLKRLK